MKNFILFVFKFSNNNYELFENDKFFVNIIRLLLILAIIKIII